MLLPFDHDDETPVVVLHHRACGQEFRDLDARLHRCILAHNHEAGRCRCSCGAEPGHPWPPTKKGR